jgi:hypothetical protein
MRPVPASGQEYKNLIDDAIYEMRELQRCAEDDIDDELSDLVPVFKAIEHALSVLRRDGNTDTAIDGDLPFMTLARTYRHVIPVFTMLDAINGAHRRGLVVSN